MSSDPAEPNTEPEEIVMRRGWRGLRRVRHPAPEVLRYGPLLYRLGFLWPLHPIALVALVAVVVAAIGSGLLWLYVVSGSPGIDDLAHAIGGDPA